ncbi:MAG: beta-N-acetylhexosaminidase [Maribacter sp.]|nr:beta-N-acetylhexosaminidase [Maribacter sp.]
MYKIIVAFSLTISLFSCSTIVKKEGDFKILPLPQHHEITGVSDLKTEDVNNYFAEEGVALPILGVFFGHLKMTEKRKAAQVLFAIDSTLDLKAEGYVLNISKDQITIKGKDKAGLFYGFQTLGQLLVDAKEQNANLPLCSITDYPLLAYRAVHLDVKHHLERTDYYYKLIDRLASYKVNAILVEMEDKLQYKRQPKVASSDAISIDEWKKISEYAQDRNIEISPLIQGLGHASFILKHDEYKDLRDVPESDWAFNPLNPRTYEVQFDLYLDAIEATPHGKYLHVGGDEVNTTGRNSGISALELQLDWLNKVCAFAADHGRIPIFWDDMPLKQADVYAPMFKPEMSKAEVDSIWAQNEPNLLKFLDKFPKNCIYMRWNYSSPEAYGNTKAMDWFRKHGLKVLGATAGQTRWVLMPLEESNMDNIRNFASNSIESGLNGLLLTLWDDDSPHFELYIRGIIAFAEYTWSGEKRDKKAIKSAYRQREFSHDHAGEEYAFIDSLEAPVSFSKNALLIGNSRNYLKSMENPMEKSVIDLPNRSNKGEWSKKYAERLEKATQILKNADGLTARIALAKEKAVRNLYSIEVYEQVNQIAQFAPKSLLALSAYDTSKSPAEEIEAVKNLKMLKSDFAKQRSQLEAVYAKTRILNKPKDYILDQDHHHHLANQSINFDWQFYAEMLFLEKLEKELNREMFIENTESLKK